MDKLRFDNYSDAKIDLGLAEMYAPKVKESIIVIVEEAKDMFAILGEMTTENESLSMSMTQDGIRVVISKIHDEDEA